MTRRALDIVFSAGGAVLALTLLVLGFVLADQKAFADDYVKGELGAQRITFATHEELNADKAANPDNAVTEWKSGSSCLEANAGKAMQTGKQAECYAKYYIGMHMARSATNAGFDGETYATLGPIRTNLTAEVNAAKAAGDTTAQAAAQKKLDSATSLRTTMQTGETLRGLLLTSYGFSIFGDKAGLASSVAFIAAAVLALLAIAGFVHALMGDRRNAAKDTGVVTPAPGPIGLAPR